MLLSYTRSPIADYRRSFTTDMKYGSDELFSIRSPVLRTYSPSHVSRRERYTRSLSNPCLSIDSARTVVPSNTSHLSRPKYTSSSSFLTGTRALPPVREVPLRPDSSYAMIRSPLPRRWWKTDVPRPALCTPDQLREIIREPFGYYVLPCDPYNEVYPGIYISDAPTAMCTALLKRLGVTHVLNAAQGKMRKAGQVNTTPSFYAYSGIKFHGVEAYDNIVFRLYPYFDEAAKFIDGALNNGGKVLVHCRAGISRSATLVCAFLMLKRNMSAQEAVKTVRKHRAIIPNDGFLKQLCDLNDKLQPRRKNGEVIPI